jgi:deazaflavin-dependent oxidoreductase (nitroreductase family)
MATRINSKPSVPSFIGFFNRITQRLLGAGVPLGPNALITIRGRTSGEPRTTPIAIVEIEGRRWVQSPFGDVNWVRNLRASGRATLTMGRRQELVRAIELSPEGAASFFRDVLGPYVRRLPLGSWMIGSVLGAKDILEDPVAAGMRHPVFELLAA